MTDDLASDFKGQVYSVTGGFYWAAVAAMIVAGKYKVCARMPTEFLDLTTRKSAPGA